MFFFRLYHFIISAHPPPHNRYRWLPPSSLHIEVGSVLHAARHADDEVHVQGGSTLGSTVVDARWSVVVASLNDDDDRVKYQISDKV